METFVSDLLENADLGVITKKDVRVQYKNFLGRDISAEEKAKINELVYTFVYYYASKQKKLPETKQESGVSANGDKENKQKNKQIGKVKEAKGSAVSQKNSLILKGHATDKSNIKNLAKKKHSPNKSPAYREETGPNARLDRAQRKVYPMRKRSLSSKIQLAEAVTAILVSDSESDSEQSDTESSDSESDFDRNDKNLQMAVKRLKDAREIKIQMSLARKQKKRAGVLANDKNGGDSIQWRKDELLKKMDSSHTSPCIDNKNTKPFLNDKKSPHHVNDKTNKHLEGEKKSVLVGEKVRTLNNISDKNTKYSASEKNKALKFGDKKRKEMNIAKNNKSHVGGKINKTGSGMKKGSPIVISSSEDSVMLLSDLYSPQKMEEESEHGKSGSKIPNSEKKSKVIGTNPGEANNGKVPHFRKKTVVINTSSDGVKIEGKLPHFQKTTHVTESNSENVKKSTGAESNGDNIDHGTRNPQSKHSTCLSSNGETSSLQDRVDTHSAGHLNSRTGTVDPSQTEDSGPMDVKKTPVTYSKPKPSQSVMKKGRLTIKQILKRKMRLETDSESDIERPVKKKTKSLKGVKLKDSVASRNEIMKLVKKKREAAARIKLNRQKRQGCEASDKQDKSDTKAESPSSSVNHDTVKLNTDTSDKRSVINDRILVLRESSSDILSSELSDKSHETDSIASSKNNSVGGVSSDSPPPLETDTDSPRTLVIDTDSLQSSGMQSSDIQSSTEQATDAESHVMPLTDVDSPLMPFTDTDSPIKTTPGQLRKKKLRQMELASDDDSLKNVHTSKKSRLWFNDKEGETHTNKYGYEMPDEFTTLGGKGSFNKNGIFIVSEDSSNDDEPLSETESEVMENKIDRTIPQSASNETNGAESPYLQELRKICKASGIYVRTNRHFKGCTTDEDKMTALLDALEDAGMDGVPSIKKGNELRLKREAGDLNPENIIASEEGRGRRNVKSVYSRSKDQSSMSETP